MGSWDKAALITSDRDPPPTHPLCKPLLLVLRMIIIHRIPTHLSFGHLDFFGEISPFWQRQASISLLRLLADTYISLGRIIFRLHDMVRVSFLYVWIVQIREESVFKEEKRFGKVHFRSCAAVALQLDRG